MALLRVVSGHFWPQKPQFDPSPKKFGPNSRKNEALIFSETSREVAKTYFAPNFGSQNDQKCPFLAKKAQKCKAKPLKFALFDPFYTFCKNAKMNEAPVILKMTCPVKIPLLSRKMDFPFYGGESN